MLHKSAFLLGVLAFAAPLAAHADAVPDAVAKTLATDYQLNCTAATDPTDANLNAAFALLSPDFVSIDMKGKQTAHDAFIAQNKQQIKLLHITTCDNAVESETSPDANTVVAVVTAKFAGQIQAPDGNHDLDASAKSEDTWKLVNGTWLQTQSKELRSLVKIDGKVVQDEGQ